MTLIPTIIDSSTGKERVYDIFSKLLEDRIIFLNGEINDEVAQIIISELLYLDSISNEDICLYINSPGGSVISGMSIYDTMNYIKSDVRTIVVGSACSMAAFLLASGTKGKRNALPNSEIMIHEVLGGTRGQASIIKIEAERIIKIRDKMNKLLSEMTGNTLDKINKDTERDNFMSAKEALDYGIIDEIIS